MDLKFNFMIKMSIQEKILYINMNIKKMIESIYNFLKYVVESQGLEVLCEEKI